MKQKDRINSLLPTRRYICLDTVIKVTFYLAIVATMTVGILLFLASLGIKFYTLIDLRLLESYLSIDSNILFWVSIFVVLCTVLGILSVLQSSYIGIISSIGILVLLLVFTDVYAISDYRVKNYLSRLALHQVLNESIMYNPLDNMEFHLMQKRLDCCGIINYTDWQYLLSSPYIPGSCCNNSTICYVDDPSLNKDGCLMIVHAILSNIYQLTISILTALNILGVTAIFTGYFCSYLMRQEKKDDKILRTTIPRIRTYNAGKSYQTEQISNEQNNTASVQSISGLHQFLTDRSKEINEQNFV